MSVLTFPPPPDCPNTVTLPGSPPKLEMLSRTHSNTATISSMPVFPDVGVLLPSRLGEIQVAKHIETMVVGNHDNVSALRQIMPVIGKQSSYRNDP